MCAGGCTRCTSLLRHEAARLGAVLLQAHPHHRQPLRAVLALQLGEVGEGHAAGAAPARPERAGAAAVAGTDAGTVKVSVSYPVQLKGADPSGMCAADAAKLTVI